MDSNNLQDIENYYLERTLELIEQIIIHIKQIRGKVNPV